MVPERPAKTGNWTASMSCAWQAAAGSSPLPVRRVRQAALRRISKAVQDARQRVLRKHAEGDEVDSSAALPQLSPDASSGPASCSKACNPQAAPTPCTDLRVLAMQQLQLRQ